MSKDSFDFEDKQKFETIDHSTNHRKILDMNKKFKSKEDEREFKKMQELADMI